MTGHEDAPVLDIHAEDQEAEAKRYAEAVEEWVEKRRKDDTNLAPVQMTVLDMVKMLMDLPPDAKVLICAHEFPGMENQGWYVQSLDPSNDDKFVLIEGAGPLPQGVNDGRDAQ